jgi:hypothetical protein
MRCVCKREAGGRCNTEKVLLLLEQKKHDDDEARFEGDRRIFGVREMEADDMPSSPVIFVRRNLVEQKHIIYFQAIHREK